MGNSHGIGPGIGPGICRGIFRGTFRHIRWGFRRSLPGLALAGALCAALAVVGGGAFAGPAPDRADSDVCARAATETETTLGLPAQILSAIALAETGRWDAARKASFAWPWTVNAAGTARYLPGKAEAIAEVAALRARGVSSIDVGCMQINRYRAFLRHSETRRNPSSSS